MPTSPTADEIKSAVLASANALVEMFQKNPYAFLYEADLQATLFANLRGRLPSTIAVPQRSRVGADYHLSPVYLEYRTYGTSHRIDIACLDPDRACVAELETHKHQDVYIFNRPMLVAIELKFLLMGYKPSRFLELCTRDRAKLTDLKNDPDSTRRLIHGLVLGFIQDHDQDKPGFATQQGELTGVGGITSLDGDYFVTRKMILQG